MKKIFYILLTLQTLLSAGGGLQTIYSQPVTQVWVRTYGYQDSLNDFLNDMVIDTNRNVIVTGRVATITQNTNYATVKYNSSGQQQWAAIYNGIGTNSIDEAVAVTVDKSGNIYVTGFSESGGFLTDDYVTIKYNADGVQHWLARYDGGSLDDPVAIAIDDSGYIYVSGYSHIPGQGTDYLTIKYDNNGDSVWVRRYNGPANGNDYARSMTIDKLGNVYVTGNSQSENAYTTIKYSATGQELWIKKFILGYARGLKVEVDTNYNVFVTGDVWQNDNDDIVTLKYNPSGTLMWSARYGGITNGGDNVYDMKLDNFQNIYVTGYSSSIGTGTDYVLIKYNQDGDSLWVRKYLNGSNSDNDIPYSIAIDNYGIYVTGRAADSNNNFDITTLKYSYSGVLLWTTRYPGIGKRVAIDKNNSVLVAGTIGSNVDFITIKYNQLNAISSNSNIISQDFEISNFPNPFNSSTIIKFKIPDNDDYLVEVYDIRGRIVEVIINEYKLRGNYNITYSPDNLSSGVYFFRLSSSHYKGVRKFVFLK